MANELLNNLVSYWKLDDASGDADDAHDANDGTVVGCSYGETGKIIDALGFDGNDYVNIDNVVDDINSSNVGTWSMWVKPDDGTPTSTGSILSFGDTAGGNNLIDIRVHATGVCRAFCRNSWQISTDNIVFGDGVWAHVVITHNGTTPIVYIDGVAVAQSFDTSTDITRWINSLANIDNGRIGCYNFNGGGNAIFVVGDIDEVGIWNVALTQTQITALYNDGDGLAYGSFDSGGVEGINIQLNITDGLNLFTTEYFG